MAETLATGTQSVRTGYCEVAEQPGLCGGALGDGGPAASSLLWYQA